MIVLLPYVAIFCFGLGLGLLAGVWVIATA
jgi:hypothetical protein